MLSNYKYKGLLPVVTSCSQFICMNYIHQMLHNSFDHESNRDDAQNNPHFGANLRYFKTV